MYRSKQDVDKHVESLISKLSLKEFNTRAYSVGRLYFEVGDYATCQKYVEQYISQKDNNAAAHKLLGQALQKLGQKEKALEQYKTSLNIDPAQTSLILDICELLADDEVFIDPGRAKYWCEKAKSIFPRHPVTFRLQERLVSSANPDPEAVTELLIAEIATHPKDPSLNARLLRHYLQNNKHGEAFEHGCKVEFSGNTFPNNYMWYETLHDVLKHNSNEIKNWQYQLLLLTVLERLCALSLTEIPSGSSKSLVESNKLLILYDEALEQVAKVGADIGFPEFHAGLLQHHFGQFLFHAATLLLKRAKKDQMSWRDATNAAAPLMLMAWHTIPLDTKVNWISHAPSMQQVSLQRWYLEGSFRCSQSGHYLLANVQTKNHTFLDHISQLCSGLHWRDKLYEKIFSNISHIKTKSSHFLSKISIEPTLRLPRKNEVEAYDNDAQKIYPNSLHHFIWILSNYKNFSGFTCTIFDMLIPKSRNYPNCGPETLNKLDILAFLYSATFTAQQVLIQNTFSRVDKPVKLPANITDMSCSLAQMKWWDCAYKFTQNELNTELTDIRTTLSRGIEVVRCVDNHGMDPELLCKLARIFTECAKTSSNIDDKSDFEHRSGLYYSCALPLLEKLKSKLSLRLPEKRMFDYTHRDLKSKELIFLIEECKLYMGITFINENEYDKAIEMLSNLKSPKANFHLCEAYKKLALEEINIAKDVIRPEMKTKYISLLSKAKSIAYNILDILRDNEEDTKNSLYADTHEMIEDIESHLNKIDPDISNDIDGKYSDETLSSGGSDKMPIQTNSHVYRNLSSTPKHKSSTNVTNYRSAIESQVFDNTRQDKFLEKLENQIRNLQKRDTSIYTFMEKTKSSLEDNRNLGNQIISMINSNIQNTTDQFKLLKLSVDQVIDQVGECRNDCNDVGELRKEVAELKKEVHKLKKSSSEQTIDESDVYNIDDEYRNNENVPTFPPQLPLGAPQFLPPFNQRFIPPFHVQPPYNLHGQNLYNLYNQYSQFTQPGSLPGAPPLFDPTRTPLNYPGVYPTPDQMYADMANLLPQTLPAVPPSSSVPTPVSTITTSKPAQSTSIPKKDVKQLPVNVVITSSDPLPTCTSVATPILSVTIPPEHIKGTPHNYQIQMPATNESQALLPTLLNSNILGDANNDSQVYKQPFAAWNQPNAFKTTQSLNNVTPKVSSTIDNSKLLFNPSQSSNLFDTSTKLYDSSNTSVITPNTSLNKSRTLSEKSNTSVENYDPCPDFKPIIPLPAEVAITTGEENETPIFAARAKLFRFTDKQWKERGLGEMKLLKHNTTGKVRVLMRREQVYKICANHLISSEMEIQPMKNESKAYFWVANDFADENYVLEKLCIRFKTVDIAKQFYETFQQACRDAKSTTITNYETNEPKAIPNDELKSNLNNTSNTVKNEAQLNKTVVGGFTFSSTPSFKVVKDKSNESPENEVPDVKTTKENPFSSLIFKTTNSSPFNNLVNTMNLDTESKQKDDSASILNTSDIVEEFEPNVQFKPVVPLPALVDQKTGEEDEDVLFEHRAKLLRFDGSNKEWKERGLGNIKLLSHKENHKVRLLMRRERVMKVCCNHALTEDMIFQNMPNTDKAITWCAKDFSEGEIVSETFCLRFKTSQTLNEFIEAVKTAQAKMKDVSKAAKEENNAAQQNNEIGFGDKFKSKPGSWHCETCYTNNLDNFLKCACCEQPKPSNDNEKVASQTSTIGGNLIWDKPKIVSSGVFSNEDVILNAPKFNFGVLSQTLNNTTINETTSGWGNLFKPKPDSWECQQCCVRNDVTSDKCQACSSPKDPSIKKEPNSVFGVTSQGTKYNFGIPQNQTTEPISNLNVSSIFDGSGSHKFMFEIPSKDKLGHSGFTFGIAKNTVNDDKNINTVTLSSPLKDALNLATIKPEAAIVATPIKTALLPTPQATLGSTGTGSFGFCFKPKTPTKEENLVKSPKSEKDEESDDNEYASDDEGQHLKFKPVIPMPDKIEVKTGEENENELYAQRAKLFRFCDMEWKERGKGIVKVLVHKETGKLRVLMRRDEVLNICLNHALLPEIKYTPKDEKTWLFVANDFSDGELVLEKFCLRFANKDIANQFKDVVDKAHMRKKGALITDDESDDVVFVNEVQSSSEDKVKAKALMLPENFFLYKEKEPCQGCRGCSLKDDESEGSNCFTPKKQVQTSPIFSPSSSIYGTPNNANTTMDTSVFRTPMEAKDNTAHTNVCKQDAGKSKSADKENTMSSTASTFTGIFGQQTALKMPQTDIKVTTNDTVKPSTMFANVLSATTASNETSNSKPIFGSNTSSSTTFGNLNSNSIFGNINSFNNTSKPMFNFSADIKGNDNSVNPADLFRNSAKIFGANATGNFGNNNGSISSENVGGEKSEQFFGGFSGLQWPVVTAEQQGPVNKISAEKNIIQISNGSKKNNDNKNDQKNVILPFDGTLTFEALSAGTSEFNIQRQSDFKWEGAGQQIFGVAKNNQGSTEDEYDPHYEPIIPLPDKIVVTTGEEDEENIFGERCKLYRYDEEKREWKERGVGEMKILYHPEKKTYRLLLRREQVHKAVLNTLLYKDLELLLMKKTDRAWTWACRNFAESPEGVEEKLAARFKTMELANSFKSAVEDCVQKLQSRAAVENEDEANSVTALLRLPKHLECTARVDSMYSPHDSQRASGPQMGMRGERGDGVASEKPESKTEQHVDSAASAVTARPEITYGNYREVNTRDNEDDDDDDDGDDDDEDNEYNDYYGDDDDTQYFTYNARVVLRQMGEETTCPKALIHLSYDRVQRMSKILIVDPDTEEVLSDMIIHPEQALSLDNNICSWTGLDITNDDKTVIAHFPDQDTALEFFDAFETTKAACYTEADA